MSKHKEASIAFGSYHTTLVSALALLVQGGNTQKINDDMKSATTFATFAGKTFLPPEQREPVMRAFQDLRDRVRTSESTASASLAASTLEAIDDAVAKIKEQPKVAPIAGNGHAAGSMGSSRHDKQTGRTEIGGGH